MFIINKHKVIMIIITINKYIYIYIDVDASVSGEVTKQHGRFQIYYPFWFAITQDGSPQHDPCIGHIYIITWGIQHGRIHSCYPLVI
jgi:hypothetical protein